MRTEKEIRNELITAQETYRANAATWNLAQIATNNATVKTLQQELSECLSDGAKPCPNCGNKPHGMLRKEREEDGIKLKVYEVGCVVCLPYVEEGNRISYSSKGGSVADAVENWNDDKYISRPALPEEIPAEAIK